MQVLINQCHHELPDSATLAEALAAGGFKPPFAAAVNLQFIPKTHYAATLLAPGDQVEVISPITGG